MRILIDIGHPGHVHLYKNLIADLKSKNHQVFVTVKDIPIAKELLNFNKIDYLELGKKKDSLLGKLFYQLKYNMAVARIVWKHKIQLGIGSSITIAHVSRVCPMKSIILDDDDDEVQPLFVKYAHPFADIILSPDAVKGHRKSKKTFFYPGYHELAYLHPSRFIPDESVLMQAGIKKGEIFFIMRFNVFKAHHDVNVLGLSLQQKLTLVEILKQYGKVLITTEREIEPELKEYQLIIPPEKIHSLMFFAELFLGDSQTMTSEAAVLGTPSIRCNSLVGKISYLEEEEHKYNLTFGFKPSEFDNLLLKVKSLLGSSDLKSIWKGKKEKMLKDKIDVTAFFSWFVENYPTSKKIIKDFSNFKQFLIEPIV